MTVQGLSFANYINIFHKASDDHFERPNIFKSKLDQKLRNKTQTFSFQVVGKKKR